MAPLKQVVCFVADRNVKRRFHAYKSVASLKLTYDVFAVNTPDGGFHAYKSVAPLKRV